MLPSDGFPGLVFQKIGLTSNVRGKQCGRSAEQFLRY